MIDPAHEKRLIDEYCGDNTLLRTVYAEYRALMAEKREAEKSLPRVVYMGDYFV